MPTTRHLVVDGQVIDESDETVAPLMVSAVQAIEDPRPEAATPERVIGDEAATPILPVPIARQVELVGQITWVSAETVNPVAVPVTQAPAAAGPDTMIGEDEVVPRATHPLADAGHWRPYSEVVAGTVSDTQTSLAGADRAGQDDAGAGAGRPDGHALGGGGTRHLGEERAGGAHPEPRE